MTTDEAAALVSTALEKAGTPYLIVGGYSSNVHGIPHSTTERLEGLLASLPRRSPW